MAVCQRYKWEAPPKKKIEVEMRFFRKISPISSSLSRFTKRICRNTYPQGFPFFFEFNHVLRKWFYIIPPFVIMGWNKKKQLRQTVGNRPVVN